MAQWLSLPLIIGGGLLAWHTTRAQPPELDQPSNDS
jgi:prolipoprotein diacylglyceryltransferase